MGILFDKNAKAINQLMAGTIGSFHTGQVLACGTQMVAVGALAR